MPRSSSVEAISQRSASAALPVATLAGSCETRKNLHDSTNTISFFGRKVTYLRDKLYPHYVKIVPSDERISNRCQRHRKIEKLRAERKISLLNPISAFSTLRARGNRTLRTQFFLKTLTWRNPKMRAYVELVRIKDITGPILRVVDELYSNQLHEEKVLLSIELTKIKKELQNYKAHAGDLSKQHTSSENGDTACGQLSTCYNKLQNRYHLLSENLQRNKTKELEYITKKGEIIDAKNQISLKFENIINEYIKKSERFSHADIIQLKEELRNLSITISWEIKETFLSGNNGENLRVGEIIDEKISKWKNRSSVFLSKVLFERKRTSSVLS